MKSVFLAALALLLVLSVSPATAETANYGNVLVNGDTTYDPADNPWDLTKCDLVISYRLDMSGYTPPMWTTAWSSVGVRGGASGWMASGAPAAYDTNPNSLDNDDKLNLGAPQRYDESSYDATGPETLVTPPIGNPWLNYGIWFDRDGVDQWQALMWGMADGVTYNTGGIYGVLVTYHAIAPASGTMFATVNGVQTGFYDTWVNGPPHHTPAGKSLSGDLTKLQVFASVWGNDVKLYDLTATGCRYWSPIAIDIKPGSDPNSINLGSKGNVTVAVLTSDAFDASTIDPATASFAGASALRWNYEDVDRDGDIDLVFHFKTQDLNLTPSSTSASLTADTTDGSHVKGTDTVNIVPKGK